MSRAGRTLFFAIILSLQITSSFGAEPIACIRNVLDTAIKNPSDFRHLHDLQMYNQRIRKPISEIAANEIPAQFESALAQIHAYNRAFPGEDFLAWYKKNPFTEVELKALASKNKTFGDALHAKAMDYEKTKTAPFFEKDIQKLSDEFDLIKKKCVEDAVCYEREVTNALVRADKGLFKCIKLDYKTRANIISGFMVSTAGMIYGEMKQNDPKRNHLRDAPYDLFLNGALWTSIFGEIGCRNSVNASAKLVGEEVKPQSKAKKIFTKVATPFVSWGKYMIWSPIEEGSYMVIHNLSDQMKGEKVDWKPKTMVKDIWMYMGYDAAFSMPRTILFTDPVFNRFLPDKIKPRLLRGLGPQLGNGVYRTVVMGAKFEISSLTSPFFKEYEAHRSFNFVGTAVKSKAAEATEYLYNLTHDQPAPKASAGKEVKPAIKTTPPPPVAPEPEVKPVLVAEHADSKKSCETLKKTYETCLNAKLDKNSDVEMDSESKRGTPTVKDCKDDLNAYEAQCGSYW